MQHAKLSASSAHRWLNCPPSVRLSEQFPSKTSSHAEAGRLAHSIAELKARKHFLEPMSTRTYNARLKKLQADPYYDKGMEDSTDTYLEVLKETAMGFVQAPFVALETRVNFSDWVPEGFGTADCIMISGDTIVIIDYKNGAGVPVEAEENPQMMLYALGALQTYAPIFGRSLSKVLMKIVQPNAGGTKSWETTVDHLKKWATETVKPTAELAMAGEGEFCAGDWCDNAFCPAKAVCEARSRRMLALEPLIGTKPLLAQAPGQETKSATELLTDAQVGDVLQRARNLKKWVEALEDYALSAVLAGREIPGFKAVAGRGSKSWTDLDDAFAALQERGVEEALLWERKPVTVAGLEKALGKKAFKAVSEGLWVKTPGKPALVPESDKRPAYNAAAIAFGGGS